MKFSLKAQNSFGCLTNRPSTCRVLVSSKYCVVLGGGWGVKFSRLYSTALSQYFSFSRALKIGQAQRVTKEQPEAGAQPLGSVTWGGVPWQIRFAFN